ncbi:MAG TPA: hypothetical protein VL501_09525 [Pyrinomonadaceae bacterium]|nr:hypothetical protein [Pyrinomonadaceae bacterium]
MVFGSLPVLAQPDDPDSAPPPIKLIPKDEKSQLAAQANLKDHTKTALGLMDFHLAAAEKLMNAGDPTGAFRELGSFEALIDDSLAFLGRDDRYSGKVLDSFKKLEIGFRAFMPRLETVRRGLPLECDEYVRNLMHNLRDARAKAVDTMFSDNVVKNPGEQL